MRHICIFHLRCWKEFWKWGMPLRVYSKYGDYWDIPILSKLADIRSDMVWREID